jgi:hypothetical protein
MVMRGTQRDLRRLNRDWPSSHCHFVPKDPLNMEDLASGLLNAQRELRDYKRSKEGQEKNKAMRDEIKKMKDRLQRYLEKSKRNCICVRAGQTYIRIRNGIRRREITKDDLLEVVSELSQPEAEAFIHSMEQERLKKGRKKKWSEKEDDDTAPLKTNAFGKNLIEAMTEKLLHLISSSTTAIEVAKTKKRADAVIDISSDGMQSSLLHTDCHHLLNLMKQLRDSMGITRKAQRLLQEKVDYFQNKTLAKYDPEKIIHVSPDRAVRLGVDKFIKLKAPRVAQEDMPKSKKKKKGDEESVEDEREAMARDLFLVEGYEHIDANEDSAASNDVEPMDQQGEADSSSSFIFQPDEDSQGANTPIDSEGSRHAFSNLMSFFGQTNPLSTTPTSNKVSASPQSSISEHRPASSLSKENALDVHDCCGRDADGPRERGSGASPCSSSSGTRSSTLGAPSEQHHARTTSSVESAETSSSSISSRAHIALQVTPTVQNTNKATAAPSEAPASVPPTTTKDQQRRPQVAQRQTTTTTDAPQGVSTTKSTTVVPRAPFVQVISKNVPVISAPTAAAAAPPPAAASVRTVKMPFVSQMVAIAEEDEDVFCEQEDEAESDNGEHGVDVEGDEDASDAESVVSSVSAVAPLGFDVRFVRKEKKAERTPRMVIKLVREVAIGLIVDLSIALFADWVSHSEEFLDALIYGLTETRSQAVTKSFLQPVVCKTRSEDEIKAAIEKKTKSKKKKKKTNTAQDATFVTE